MPILTLIAGFFKALGIVLGLVQQNRDQQVGAELQKGADAQAILKQAQDAVAARDSVVPDTRSPDGTYRLPDGSRDPAERD